MGKAQLPRRSQQVNTLYLGRQAGIARRKVIHDDPFEKEEKRLIKILCCRIP